jgi:hypothetical protein
VPPRSLRPVPEDRLFTQLDALAAAADGPMRRRFLDAMRKAMMDSDRRKLVLGLMYGDPDMAEGAVPWVKLEIDLGKMFTSGNPALRALAAGAGDAGAWMAQTEERRDAVIEKLDERGALRARGITDETRRGVRAFVSEGHLAGRSLADIQRDVESTLYADGGFGLDERSARIVGRRLARMVEDGNLSPKDRAQALRTLQRQALATRARRIVASELNAVMNQSMLAQWQAEGSVTHKEWVARMDSKTCERCAAFDGVVVPLEEDFVSRLGEVAPMPEIHPNGYCVMRAARKTATPPQREREPAPQRAPRQPAAPPSAEALAMRRQEEADRARYAAREKEQRAAAARAAERRRARQAAAGLSPTEGQLRRAAKERAWLAQRRRERLAEERAARARQRELDRAAREREREAARAERERLRAAREQAKRDARTVKKSREENTDPLIAEAKTRGKALLVSDEDEKWTVYPKRTTFTMDDGTEAELVVRVDGKVKPPTNLRELGERNFAGSNPLKVVGRAVEKLRGAGLRVDTVTIETDERIIGGKRYATGRYRVAFAGKEVEIDDDFDFDDDADDGFGALDRTYTNNGGDDWTVSHSLFKVPAAAQEKGLGKAIFSDLFDSYAASEKIAEVQVHANIDVGGYAWLRYGFVPDVDSTAYLADLGLEVLESMQTRGKIDPAQAEVVSALLLSGKGEDIVTFAGLKIRGNYGQTMGQEAFLGSDWHGSVNMRDKRALQRTLAYVRKK